jgi:hypothetical protein
MKNFRLATLTAALAALSTMSEAAVLTNGGFESGLTGWTVADLTDPLDPAGTNTFFVQSGTTSPVNLLPVAAPPEGSNAAMSDSGGPGSHVLYQDFLVPTVVEPFTMIRFSLYINNLAEDFFIPSPTNTLDFSTTARNQQARVDIMTSTSDPFSLAAGDIVLNLFQTQPGDPLVSGYQTYSTDVTALLQARAGQTLRLRFAEVNNVDIFNLGVDDVAIESVIPEPSTVLLVAGALLGLGARRRGVGLLKS